jgi:hypothetical protein
VVDDLAPDDTAAVRRQLEANVLRRSHGPFRVVREYRRLFCSMCGWSPVRRLQRCRQVPESPAGATS